MAPAREKLPPPPVPSPGVVRFDDILHRLEARGRVYEEAFLRQVYVFSAQAHRDQTRRSGEPYLTHPLSVAYLLADLKFDQTCVAVGLLHDVLEDTLTTKETLEETFGAEVTELVDGVTKIGRHEYVRRDEAQAETFRKMILASAKDIRVILVKLADRLHNMQTLEHMPPETRRRISRETLEIYAPIAHRLGMARVKGDLEDLAFYYLYPHQYAELHSRIAEKLEVGKEAISALRVRLVKALEEAGIEAEISYRVKRYYSIYQKLRRQGIDISQLYDYLAFRIVTDDLRDTYAALGVVHQHWRPIPGRFKDYIAMPKPNLYQSLHTTVVGERGQPFEVQIRTREMDLVAEEGIAAHWHYKEGGRPAPGERSEHPLAAAAARVAEGGPGPAHLPDQPEDRPLPGRGLRLHPQGRGPLFPARRHAARLRLQGPHRAGPPLLGRAGQRQAGAPAHAAPQRRHGRDPDQPEPPAEPRLAQLRGHHPRQEQDPPLAQHPAEAPGGGDRPAAAREGDPQYRLSPKKVLEGERFERYLKEEGLSNLDDLLARIGFGKSSRGARSSAWRRRRPAASATEEPGRLRQAVTRLLPGRGDGPILVKGHGDLLAYMAKCCNPLPGEQIVGYITRGRGVSVHSVDCPNVRNLLYNPEREIEVRWAKEVDEVFGATLFIETEDQKGMLAKLTEVVAEFKSNITHIGARTTETGHGLIEMKLEVRDRKHLLKILQGLRKANGVLRVTRQMSASSSVGETASRSSG